MTPNQQRALDGLRAVLRHYDLRDQVHGLGADVDAAVRGAVFVLSELEAMAANGSIMVRVDAPYVEQMRNAEGLRGPFSSISLEETDQPRLMLRMGERPPTAQTIESLIAALAQCYRLTGADPDGDEDWRLAPHAVEEVKRLRAEHDALEAELEKTKPSPASVTRDGEPREWLIVDGRTDQFWGPDSGGYFGLWGAGLYTETEAKRIAGNKCETRRDRAHHITEYRDQIANMRGAFERLSSALAAADSRRVPHGTINTVSATKAGKA